MNNQPYNSIPRAEFHNAVTKYSFRKFYKAWTGTRTNTIDVYEIAREGNYELHLSSILDPTSWNVTKIHFTLRKGPGKGIDAFAWFEIEGFNKNAKLLERNNRGMVQLFKDLTIPQKVKAEVENIDNYAREIFAEAISYIK